MCVFTVAAHDVAIQLSSSTFFFCHCSAIVSSMSCAAQTLHRSYRLRLGQVAQLALQHHRRHRRRPMQRDGGIDQCLEQQLLCHRKTTVRANYELFHNPRICSLSSCHCYFPEKCQFICREDVGEEIVVKKCCSELLGQVCTQYSLLSAWETQHRMPRAHLRTSNP